MFNSAQSTFFFIGCLATLVLMLLVTASYLRPKQKYFPKKVITPFEAKMFARLKQAFPEHHILAQVAFSALITNSNYKIRSRFNRKVTDFVLLDQQMNVVIIIELDDPTHIGKESEDAERDAMLLEACYQVIRYTEIPSIRQLQQDIL